MKYFEDLNFDPTQKLGQKIILRWLLVISEKQPGCPDIATIIENMLSWRHSGFNVYIGDRIFSNDKASPGNLARYSIRACFER